MTSTLFTDAKQTHYHQGEVLIHGNEDPGEILSVVRGYCFVISYSPSGEQRIHAIYGPGAVFPLRYVLQDKLPIATFEAFTPMDVDRVSKKSFLNRLPDDDNHKQLLDVVLHQFGCYVRGVEVLEITNAPGRLSQKLIDLTNQLARQVAKGHELPFPLTHQQLARLTKMSRETASRIMAELQKQKIIESDRTSIRVLDLAKLTDYSMKHR